MNIGFALCGSFCTYSQVFPIMEQLAKQHGITVDKRKITLNDPIKAYGTYALDVRLYTDVAGKINLVVAEA